MAFQNKKNPTPKQIAFYSAILITSIYLISAVILAFIPVHFINWYVFLIVPAIMLFGGYLIIETSVERFIYRKIKLIYKTITTSKHTKNKVSEMMNTEKDNIIDEVNKEVNALEDSQEEEIKQLKTMEEYRKQFLGDVSHELKTPLFHIQGYIETLIDGGIDDSNINKVYLKKAAENVDRLSLIIKDLETISLIEHGKLSLNIEHFNIRILVEEIFEFLNKEALEKKITLKFKKGILQNPIVKADKNDIRQVLLNLVTNSIKYGNEDGNTSVGFYDMDKKIMIEVSDNGIGIPDKHLSRIFDRFYRVDKSRSRSRGGTGLGLSIVKNLLEAHGENINVRSTYSVGSTFSFTLPKA